MKLARWLPTSPRAQLVFAFDLCAAAAAWLVAFWLRFNLSVPAEYAALAMTSLAWVLPLYALVFLAAGLYRGLWRFASLNDLRGILKAAGSGGALVALAAYLQQMALPVPRSVVLLSPLLLLVFMGGARALYRSWVDRRPPASAREGRPLLVIGANEAAAALLRSLGVDSGWRVVGLLDDERATHGRELLGHPILGGLEDIGDISHRHGVRDAIIALPRAGGAQRRRAAQLCLQAGLRASTLPALADVIGGPVNVRDVRRIDLDDLLGREPVRIDGGQLTAMLADRVVLVTGAGGSIGSELCRQIARLRPARLVFFEHGEFALYRLVEEFRQEFPHAAIVPLLGDVKDAKRVRDVFQSHRPEIVFHAAAYKHVGLVEAGNESPALNNNAWGTHVVASAACEAGVGRFVLVSTDKAVRPTNVMGATKRLAEMICQAHQQAQARTVFTMVRFGNVLGSAGSVVPKFAEQIAQGGPVTVTHPEVTRYFMSIPEACQLVMEAAAMGTAGQIFVLDMGEPVRIVDLARLMIALAGRSADDVEIMFTGLLGGEKLHEQLVADYERAAATPHPKIGVTESSPPDAAWLDQTARLLRSHLLDSGDARALLRDLVPEFAAVTDSGRPG